MDKHDLFEYLKDNLSIEIKEGCCWDEDDATIVEVELKLISPSTHKQETISSSSLYLR